MVLFVLYLIIQAEQVSVILPHLCFCFRDDLTYVPVQRQVSRQELKTSLKPFNADAANNMSGFHGGGIINGFIQEDCSAEIPSFKDFTSIL